MIAGDRDSGIVLVEDPDPIVMQSIPSRNIEGIVC